MRKFCLKDRLIATCSNSQRVKLGRIISFIYVYWQTINKNYLGYYNFILNKININAKKKEFLIIVL